MKFDRNSTIKWLEINRDNGFFDGFDEEDIDFNKLSNDDLEWYFDEWIILDRSI